MCLICIRQNNLFNIVVLIHVIVTLRVVIYDCLHFVVNNGSHFNENETYLLEHVRDRIGHHAEKSKYDSYNNLTL